MRKIELTTIEIPRGVVNRETTVVDRRVYLDPVRKLPYTCGSPEPREREHVNYESACGHQIGFLFGILALAPSGGQRQVLRVFHGIA